ncbi:hypothetical protein F0562_011965 [Nyssa sinensis]|uniref:CCHC-type domain-containing protein n=1 Tax=Nyssa sinensis TaxID=561372 RepID=A0A5J4ZT86_9ASTE|nr:hypothetical protein F0562_011965 [Nyssa sinensis]
MGRKCSHCGNMGHNSRTCTIHKTSLNGGLRLFGVHLDITSSSIAMKKSFSMDCLLPSSSTPSSSTSSRLSIDENSDKLSKGYLSDGLIRRTQERKKGMPWTEEEHRIFLVGLESLGRKYFLRQNSLNKLKKRRPSLFDHHVVGKDKLVDANSTSMTNEASISCGLSPIPKTNDSMIEFHTFQAEDSKSRQVSAPVWPYGSLINSQYYSTTTSNLTKPTAPPPDLELKLAAPRPFNDSTPSPHSQYSPRTNKGHMKLIILTSYYLMLINDHIIILTVIMYLYRSIYIACTSTHGSMVSQIIASFTIMKNYSSIFSLYVAIRSLQYIKFEIIKYAL